MIQCDLESTIGHDELNLLGSPERPRLRPEFSLRLAVQWHITVRWSLGTQIRKALRHKREVTGCVSSPPLN